MERSPMLMGGEWCGRMVGYPTTSHLQIQYESHQNSNQFVTEIRKTIISIFIWKHKISRIATTILNIIGLLKVLTPHISSYSTEL